jgi:hypothetical protein
MSNILDTSMLVCDLTIPKEYHSLMVRLNSIYGATLSLESLFRISTSDFSSHQGVGKMYINRFQTIKKLLYKRYSNDDQQLFLEDIMGTITFDSQFPNTALFQEIKECFPYVKSYKDISTISPDRFALYPGVGKKKVQELIRLQSELTLNEQDSQVDDKVISQLESYRFSALFLSPSEDKLLKKLQHSDITLNKITPSSITKIRPSDMVKWDGFGVTSCKVLQTLQSRILESIKYKSSLGILIPNQFGQSLSLSELCPLVAEDLSNFFSILSDKEIEIWCARLGYQTELMTLQELGLKLDLTRERIRQLSVRLNDRFLRGVRVSPNVLQQKIIMKTRVELFDDLKDLRPLFNTDNDLIKMLALIANEDVSELVLRFNPIVRRNVLDGFLCWHPFPARRHEIISFLHDEVGGTDEEIENYFSALINANIIYTDGNNVIPSDLGKELAISHILAGFPEGLGWKEIAFIVNQSEICRATLSLERPDPNLSFSSYFFQSGQHTYSHFCFFPIGKKQIKLILKEVESALIQSKYKSFHLMAEYYSNLETPQYDYYTVRHTVRNFGESYGLYFNGKSQSDTVSLYPISNTISQKEAIKRLFLENEASMSVQEITKLIKSQSEYHARLYLNELMASGVIVAIEVNQYQIRESAFSRIDINSIKDSIRKMITEDRRLHHISIIAHHVNQIYGYDYSNRFWRSFAVAYAKEMNWFVKYTFISMDHIKIKGLLELVQINRDKTQEDIIATIQQKVCVSRNEIKRAIQNNNMKSQDTRRSNNEVQGLASDVMEELYLL